MIPTDVAIGVSHIVMSYGDGTTTVRALDDVSIEILHNEFFTLLGPSGCGKTTLLRLIAGFEQATSGNISLYGQQLAGLPPFKRDVNTVFQNYALFPHLSVAQNVAFGLVEQRNQGKDISQAEMSRTVDRMLELVHLEGYGHRKPSQLSGGQQQRVALARALAVKPKVLLLDEPLSALDLKLRQDMRLELKRLQHDTGITFIFVTHDQDEALTMSNRLAVMSAGTIQQVGTPSEIYDSPRNTFVADFIGDTNFLDVTLHNGIAVLQNGNALGALGSLGTAALSTNGPAQIAVRPERASIAKREQQEEPYAIITEVVYMGTDTLYYLNLGGPKFKVRMPNTRGATRIFEVGDRVQLNIPDTAIQVLES